MIPQSVIDDLISVGNAGQPAIPASFTNSRLASRVVQSEWEEWKSVAARLEQQALQALIKGIVLYSRSAGWTGGSVSPVIPLYRSFISRWPEDEPALTAWIVDNTENPYEPFGSAVHGKSRSQAELLVFHAARARIASKNIDAEEERARIAQVARAARGTMNLYNAVRRGDLQALKALIETGADWRQVVREKGSLVKLAEEKGRSLVIEYLKSIGVE